MQTKPEIAIIDKAKFYRNYGKRILDLLLTLPTLIILFPIFIIVGLLIRLDSSGPIIYKQKRVGKNKQEFYVYKFRTMVSNADKVGPTSTKTGDSRITKVGKILRNTSIDELPQLINVLVGNMSLVGYRPGVRDENTEKNNSRLFELKPGITGYAQTNGRSSLTTEEKRAWELKYVNDISFATDIKIMINTIRVILTGKGTN